MRYVRCHECGSTEVPTLATCPSCGIKTPIRIRQRWWLLGVAAIVGAAVGIAIWHAASGSGRRIRDLERQMAALREEDGVRRPDGKVSDTDFRARGSPGASERRMAQVARVNEALRRKLAELAARQPPTRPAVRIVPTGDDRLRSAHVCWAAVYMSASRLWRPPYVPFAHLTTLEEGMGRLESETRRFAAALAASPDGPDPQMQETLRDFERRLPALRRSLDPDRWRRAVVSARDDWRESTVEVAPGDLVYLSAHGRWEMAAATPAADAEPEEPPAPERFVDGFPLGALLWRVSGAGGMQAVLPGVASFPVRVEGQGAIAFRINERALDDNAGALNVDILLLPKDLISALETAGARLLGG